MYFDNFTDFWAMGGYGFYVWLSFAIGLLCVVLMWLESATTKKHLLSQALMEQARQERIKQASQQQPFV